jgi:hypothetical protein
MTQPSEQVAVLMTQRKVLAQQRGGTVIQNPYQQRAAFA